MSGDGSSGSTDTDDSSSQDESQDSSDTTEADGSSASVASSHAETFLTTLRQQFHRQKILQGAALLAVFGILLVVAFVPAGFLGLAINDKTTFTASPAAPDNATVTEAGYELQTADEVTVEQEISLAGQDRTIVVNNQRRTYERAVAVQNRSFNTGVFVTLSTPAIRVAGSSQNPLADMSDRELLQRFSDQLTDGSGNPDFERVGTREAAMAGSATDVGEFQTTVSVDGEPQEVIVYVTRVRSQNDIIVAVGVHPTAFPGDRVSIFQMLYAVEHQTK